MLEELGRTTSGETSVTFIIISVILSTIVAATMIGNLFVILAILLDKNLQTTANQLVLSLAVADLMVACLVMPLGAYNDIHNGWYLSKEVCEFWTSADVLCCTGKSLINVPLTTAAATTLNVILGTSFSPSARQSWPSLLSYFLQLPHPPPL